MEKTTETVTTEISDDLLNSLTTHRPAAHIDGVVIGSVVGLSGEGVVQVDYPGCPSPKGLPARTTTALDAAHQGREVALMFERGDPSRPIVMGLIQHPARQEITLGESTVQVEMDSQRLELTAQEEIVLRCGHASIVLTRAGKILLRGKYLLTRSSGVNRIKGGSVQIN